MSAAVRVLINLVGDQVMPNLLTVMAWRPDVIFQLRSADARYAAKMEHLKEAVRCLLGTRAYAGYSPSVTSGDLPSAVASRAETAAVLRGLYQRYPGAVVNLTGGTKLMSIGAYEAARERGAPTIYCDTQRRCFELTPAGALPAPPSFDELARQLTVTTVMAANGTGPGAWRSDQITAELLAYGRAVQQVRETDAKGLGDYIQALDAHYRGENRRVPSGKGKLRALVESPLPAPSSPAATALLAAAVAAGLVRPDGPGRFVPVCAPERSAVESLATLLSGGAFELYVLGLILAASQRYTDVHWGLEPQGKAAAAFGETDIVAVDLATCGLIVISCKTRVHQPLEHLEALAQRTRDLGGSHVQAVLCVMEAQEEERRRLTTWGRLLGVRVLIGADIAPGLPSQPVAGAWGSNPPCAGP